MNIASSRLYTYDSVAMTDNKLYLSILTHVRSCGPHPYVICNPGILSTPPRREHTKVIGPNPNSNDDALSVAEAMDHQQKLRPHNLHRLKTKLKKR